jgi:hypothetical protein
MSFGIAADKNRTTADSFVELCWSYSWCCLGHGGLQVTFFGRSYRGELTAAIGLVWSSASACLAVVCIHYHRDDQLRAVNEACMMQERTVCQRKYVS